MTINCDYCGNDISSKEKSATIIINSNESSINERRDYCWGCYTMVVYDPQIRETEDDHSRES